MSNQFSLHPSGYVGVMEGIRDWAENMPLNGADPVSNNGKARMALIQFSGFAAFSADVSWQEDNFLG
eukprot:gene32872-12496_t